MKDLNKLLADFNGIAGAPQDAIQLTSDVLKAKLPGDYRAFLEATNGGEGMIGETYIMLWRIEELGKMNESYQVAEYAPGLLLIGSDGGGEAFAFDMRNDPWPVVKVPFVGMDLQYVEFLSSSFYEFLRVLKG